MIQKRQTSCVYWRHARHSSPSALMPQKRSKTTVASWVFSEGWTQRVAEASLPTPQTAVGGSSWRTPHGKPSTGLPNTCSECKRLPAETQDERRQVEVKMSKDSYLLRMNTASNRQVHRTCRLHRRNAARPVF